MHKVSDNVLTWLPPDTIEPEAMTQIKNISEMPFLFKHVAVMPDCHLGKGATVGSVIATEKAIIPAAVGVDIGCGMIAVKTSLFAKDLPDDLSKLRHSIERSIPCSAGNYNRDITATAKERIIGLEAKAKGIDYMKVADWHTQVGTLGSGNHFIEVSLDADDRVWLVLHSGSRGVGNKLAQRHIAVAQGLCQDMFVALKDRDLAYLPENSQQFKDYIRDLLWAQDFAKVNRDEMMDRVLKDLSFFLYGENGHQETIEVERVNCHHNFTQKEHHFGKDVWLTRKGAIQVQDGQYGVIPGSMGTRSYIVSGKGNPLAFNSAPHGAGRRFSRTEARKRLTMTDFDEQMKGIECRRTDKLIDELPAAYKDIDEVMENAKELVNVHHVLRQILNVKGD
jgi:tRNA-splicing ligase RtcB